ncbi:MAG: DNA polymerase III subunit delta [Patescibacteria group bacterium]
MIMYLHGPDTYRLRQRLQYYQAGFRKKYDPQGYNTTVLDGEKLTLEALRQAIGQVGFLATKRLVVIENVITKNKSKQLGPAIVDYLTGEYTGDAVIICVEEEVDTGRGRGRKSAHPLAVFLDKEATVESFPLLTGVQLTTWIQQEVRRRGGRIESSAVGEMAGLIGSDLWEMAAEIEKLINYRAGQLIRAADVRQMVRAAYDENIFHLSDALAARDTKTTVRLLHDQFASGAAPLYILTMVIRQFRILLQVRSLAETEPHPATIARRLGLHPFVVQKAVRDIRRYKIDELKMVYGMLLDTDIALKTSSQNPQLMFDLLVTRLGTARA